MEDHKITFGTLSGSGQFSNIRMIKQSDIAKCTFFILAAEHYREDGSCKCDDSEHRKLMINKWGYKKSHFKGIPLRNE